MLSILPCADRYKQTTWELWEQAANPPREHAPEPGTALALPDLRSAVASEDAAAVQPNSYGGAAEGSELEASMHHPKRSTPAAVNVCNSEPEGQEPDSVLFSTE